MRRFTMIDGPTISSLRHAGICYAIDVIAIGVITLAVDLC